MTMRVDSAFHAVGSGRDFAIAAMHYGKSAREAVELACLYDVSTGLPLTEISYKRPQEDRIHLIEVNE